MKRYGNLHSKLIRRENIELADNNARKGKSNIGIIEHDKHRKEDNDKLQSDFINLTYHTSEYNIFKIYEPKEREIYRLPYYPDRIAHHALMNILEPIWVKIFISHTYSCISGRGIHKCAKDLKKVLRKDVSGTKYCLKLDVKKFYPSIDHNILKSIVRRKIKDKKLLVILDEIIDSSNGVPIGNYLSQFFANLYLTYFDHWLKEECKVKYYFRYADDIVILSDNKDFLHNILVAIKLYLKYELNLQVKDNYQIFPVESRGVDFVGYKFYHKYTLLRKSIKIKMLRLVNKYNKGLITREDFINRMASYSGWMKYCNSKHLLNKIEELTHLHISNWDGLRTTLSKVYNKNVRFIEYIVHKKYFDIHFIYKGLSYSVISSNKSLYKNIADLGESTNYIFIKYGKKTRKY